MTEICVSFSGMRLYDQCPSAFKRRYITKEPVKDGEGGPSPAAARGTRVHRGVELYLKGHKEALPEEALGFQGLFEEMLNEREDVMPERTWAFTPDWEEVPFGDKEAAQVRGVLDIVYEHDGVCNVVELKTGKKYDAHALQRSLYGLAGALLYPDVDMVNVRTVYLDGGMTDELSFSSGQVTTYKYIWQRFINKCQPPQPYPETPSWKCRFCPYHKDKGGTCNG